MAKKKKQDPISVLNAADLKHYRDTEKYVKIVDRLYKDAISDISQLAAKVGAIPATDQFSFSKNPAISQQVDAVIQKLASRIQAVIETGDREQWDAACAKSVAFLGSIMRTSAIPKPLLQSYQDRNLESLAAIQERKINGLGLSERVWSYVSPLKQEVESVADTTKAYINNGINTPGAMEKVERAIGTGMSADDLSREVRSCLKEPNKLFRRIRDKYGNLHLSKNAKLYHPGQGVYRSSYKNAKRMTRSEINMAYRQSDYLRWQQLDFVVGVRIQLSGNHTCLGKDGKPHPFYDICDELAGDYPKDFKFVGWHPQCRCIATPIMKPYDEWNEDRTHIDEKGYRQLPASNEVTATPLGFRNYIKKNQKRIAGWTSTPYYIKDNPHYVDKAINPGKYKSALQLSQDQRKQLEDFRMYAYNHQGSKKFGTALDNALESQLAGDQEAYEAAVKTMTDVQKTNDRVHNYLQEQKKKPKAAPPDPAQLRKQYDDQIAMLKKNATRYGIDVKAIDEAYVSLDIKRLKKVLDEQQKVLDEGMARKKKIWDAADRRHAARTPEKEAALKKFAKEHKAKTESVYKHIDEVIAGAKGINEADVSIIKDLKSGKSGHITTRAGKTLPTATIEKLQKEAQKLETIVTEYNTAMSEAKALVGELKGISDVDTETVLKQTSIKGVKAEIKKLQDVKDKISKLSTLDNPLQVAKDFSLADAVTTHNAVVKKIKDWETKYSTDSYLQKTKTKDEYLLEKLDFEAYTFLGGNMKGVQQKYKTWQVSQNAYIKKIGDIKEKMWVQESQKVADEMYKFYKDHTKNYSLHTKWSEVQAAIDKGDHVAFNKAVEAFNKKRSDIQSKTVSKNAIKFKEIADEDCITLIEEFLTNDSESADKYLRPLLKKVWADLTEEQRRILTKYTQTYEYLNRPLRNITYTGWHSASEAKADLVKLTEALSKQKTKKTMVVRRGTGDYPIPELGISSLGDLKPGQEFTDGAFLSTAVHKDGGFGGSYELVIVIPKGAQGTYAEPFSHYTGYGPNGSKYDYQGEIWDGKFDADMAEGNDEREWIGQRGSRFKVIKIEGDRVFLKMIGQMYDQPKSKV